MQDQDQSTGQRPEPDDIASWPDYWKAQGMPWRTEPEIDAYRQAYLAERRAVTPDIEMGIYPFRDENGSIKLTRADVEWLLATHESLGVQGPVRWKDEVDKPDDDRRVGLDLHGADLREVDLSMLPLSRLLGGMPLFEWLDATTDQRAAAIHLERANLSGVRLEGAMLRQAHLDGAYLVQAHMEDAALSGAHLEGCAILDAHLERADLGHAHLESANILHTHLDGAHLYGAHLGSATLWDVHLEGANLSFARLDGASMQEVFFDAATSLSGAIFGRLQHGAACLADVHWGDTNLAVVDWAPVRTLGDEWAAKDWQPLDYEVAAWKKLPHKEARAKERMARLSAFERAVRGNRQLATALRNQGLNEHADRFAYRAQVMQRKLLWRRLWPTATGPAEAAARWLRHLPGMGRLAKAGAWLRSWVSGVASTWGAYLLSLLLGGLAGYGYKPWRIAGWYVVTICGFAALYHVLGNLPILEALVMSVTSFHGRGFFPGTASLSDIKVILAAMEAVVGLVIEVSLIATFTQRFFGR